MRNGKTWCAALALTLGLVAVASTPAAPVLLDRPGGFQASKWLAADAQMVTVINVKTLLDSKLMKDGGLKDLKDLLKKNEQASAVLKAANIDPLKDVDAIVVSAAMGSSEKDHKALVVVRGKFDVTKASTAAADFAKKNPDELKLSKEGTIQLFEFQAKAPGNGREASMFAAFADKSTLVITPSKSGTVDAVKNGGKKAIKMNKDLDAALGKFTGKEGMAFGLVFTDEMKKAIGKLPQVADVAPKLEAITGTLNLTDAIDLGIVIGTTEAKSGTKLEAVLKQGLVVLGFMAENSDDLAGVADVLKAIKIKADKGKVNVNLKITQEMANKLKEKKSDK
jgi:hypothetical protein